jgi:F-type H+-transporting ATPase subunit delta
MSSIRLANRYAKAIMDLAVEKGQLDRVTADMRMLSDTMRSHADLTMLLRSPIIHPAKKLPILQKVFTGRVDAILMNFMEILVRKHRESHLPEIVKVYLERYNELQNIKSVRITTAQPIEAGLKDKIAESLRESASATVELESVVDPELIGGYIIRYGDKQYDASVIRNLRRLRKEFEQNTYVKKF